MFIIDRISDTHFKIHTSARNISSASNGISNLLELNPARSKPDQIIDFASHVCKRGSLIMSSVTP
jgi:hypothetical protein